MLATSSFSSPTGLQLVRRVARQRVPRQLHLVEAREVGAQPDDEEDVEHGRAHNRAKTHVRLEDEHAEERRGELGRRTVILIRLPAVRQAAPSQPLKKSAPPAAGGARPPSAGARRPRSGPEKTPAPGTFAPVPSAKNINLFVSLARHRAETNIRYVKLATRTRAAENVWSVKRANH